MKILQYCLLYLLIFSIFSCSEKIESFEEIAEYPTIFPDYIDVTVPQNIAPLNFYLPGFSGKAVMLLEGNDQVIRLQSSGKFNIPAKSWKQMLSGNKGDSISCTIYLKNENKWNKYKPFNIFVSQDSIDPYLVYRLIEPGYELWNKMGIYQRNLENFEEKAIVENRMFDHNCINCHSFCMQDPSTMLFHMRAKYPGTIFSVDGKTEKLNLKAEKEIPPLVYPSWHPSGKYVAFSINKTGQTFHENNKNRIEVYDSSSDIAVYDIEKSEIQTSPLISSVNAYETFPTFSPDGKKLYFCTAKAVPVPEKYDSVKYSLCRIEFFPEEKIFGNTVDTLYSAVSDKRSASFPRISPDGRYLMFTVSDYGNFSIWHREADLRLIDLKTLEYVTLENVNSRETESYHSWSSNSRWFVFSSRRIDGLYTRPYIASIDENGALGKPFLLPQKDPEYYERLMKSYNIPELVKGEVKIDISGLKKNLDKKY